MQTAFFNEPKEKKIGGVPRKGEMDHKHRKQNKYLGVELFKDLNQVFKLDLFILLQLSRRLTRRLNI